MHLPAEVDLLVIGGGINGAGIARDAAGRGLTVLLAEQGDLASATSSASSKLIHGGLRYLEQYEFRLVREALAEREVLLRAAPHLVHPMRFVMPHVPELRPAWMIRAGLLLYDYLARRQTLEGSARIDLRTAPCGAGLKPGPTRGFVYSDCQVDDARLVVANARAAADLGATVLPRTACTAVQRAAGRWQATLHDDRNRQTRVAARALINAAGPWAKVFLDRIARRPAPFALKLVKGSHIVVPRLYDGAHAFILQNDDRRVVFVCPYEHHYTLIGTTDVELQGDPGACAVDAEEIDYLCRAANRYFVRQLQRGNVLWHYCGIRPLVDDGAANPAAVTRDYVLHLDAADGGAPLLTVFGGKITTYRRLAEHALARLAPWFPQMSAGWTEAASLPGGALGAAGLAQYSARLKQRFPWLPEPLAAALARRHGSNTQEVLAGAAGSADLGQHFGADLYAREVDYFIRREWAQTAEDVLWRRTKSGLYLAPAQQQALAGYLAQRAG